MKYIFYILSFVFIFSACNELETYSEIPKIEYKDYSVEYTYDDTILSRKIVTLHFSILDGNGDVGLNSSDTTAPYIDSLSSNFFATIYVRKNNKWVSGKELHFMANTYRIPYLGEGKEAVLKADAYIDFKYAAKLFPYDTIVYSFYLLDRELNKSNVDSTGLIVLRSN